VTGDAPNTEALGLEPGAHVVDFGQLVDGELGVVHAPADDDRRLARIVQERVLQVATRPIALVHLETRLARLVDDAVVERLLMALLDARRRLALVLDAVLCGRARVTVRLR